MKRYNANEIRTKDDVQHHSDNSYRKGHPALNVKLHGSFGPDAEDLAEKHGAKVEDAERALQYALEIAQERFWEDAQEMAVDIFGNINVYSEGRSGGWLVVHGLPDVEEWDAVMLAKWRKLAKWAYAEMVSLSDAATVEEDILANDWLKPLSERYNFIDRKDGTTACIADLKAQAIAQGFAPVVRM